MQLRCVLAAGIVVVSGKGLDCTASVGMPLTGEAVSPLFVPRTENDPTRLVPRVWFRSARQDPARVPLALQAAAGEDRFGHTRARRDLPVEHALRTGELDRAKLGQRLDSNSKAEPA